MLTYRDFAREVLGQVTQLAALEMPITEALGCCTAADLVAARPVPGYRQADCEGFAVRSEDLSSASVATPVLLPIGGTVVAGSAPGKVATGHCIRIAAFAAVPSTLDAVLAADQCVVEDDKVVITHAPAAGDGIRDVGSQVATDALVVAQGQFLDHLAIAGLALVGKARVLVHPRPRVVIVTIGSELVAVSKEAGPTSGHDATGVLLTTTAGSLGADCYRVGPVPDDPKLVRDVIEDQLVRADILVTSGGIDNPDDVLRRELVDSGFARFDGPDLMPCSAYGVGRVGPEQTPIVALPGDPTAALLAFHALARPVIAAMVGRDTCTTKHLAPPSAVVVRSGSRVLPGRLVAGRFVPVKAQRPTLRDLAGMSAIAIQDAGEQLAEVVGWPY